MLYPLVSELVPESSVRGGAAAAGTDTNFMLGRWLHWAMAWGDDDAAKANLEYNARNALGGGVWNE